MAAAGYAAAPGGAAVGATLYIGGLDANVTDSEVYNLFSKIGEVVSVEVCEDLSSDLSLRYAYVHYKNPQCAQRASVELNLTPLMHFHQDPSTSEGDPGIEYIKKSCSLDASDQSMGHGSDEEFTKKAIKEQNDKKRFEHSDKANFVSVFVKNLCESTTDDDLKYTFGEFGLISSAVVMKNEDGTSKCFGFVNFENAEDAARAVESLNGQIIGKKKWFVARAQTKYERQQELKHDLENVKYAFDNRTNLFVKNLDRSIDDEKLKDFFSPFGSVMSCKVLRDETGNSTKRGLVAFSSAKEASDALSAMNGKVLAGKPLFVAIAQRKEDRRAQLQGYGFVQFSGEATGQEAVGELERTIGKFNGVITKLSGIIEEFNGTVRELNGLILKGKQVNIEHYLTKEMVLLVDKANFTFVFVKNFCDSATEEDLKNIFGEFGLVTDTAVMRNEDGTSKCLGFVNFKNAVDAARAVESLNGQRFDEKKMHSWRVQRKLERELELKTSSEQRVKEASDKHSNNLYVKNLNDSISDESLKELFSCFGIVTSCKVLKDREGRSIGSGFVAFSSPEESSRALGEMNGRMFLGKPLRVAIAQRKEDIKAQLQKDKEINHKAAYKAAVSSVDTGSCKLATDVTDRSMELGSCKVEQKSFKRELTKEYQSKSCVNEDVDKRSNHSIPHGKLSEVFPPIRSFESHKMMPDMNGVGSKRGFTTLSPPKKAYESLYEESPFHVAQSQRKEDRRSWLQGHQPGFGYRMRSHLHSMSVPLIQNSQQDPHSSSRQTNAGPMQKYLQPAATKQQMLPSGRHDYHCPPGGVFSVQYERSHTSLCGVIISQSVPVGALASSLANASSLNRSRCCMRYCTRILSSGRLNI